MSAYVTALLESTKAQIVDEVLRQKERAEAAEEKLAALLASRDSQRRSRTGGQAVKEPAEIACDAYWADCERPPPWTTAEPDQRRDFARVETAVRNAALEEAAKVADLAPYTRGGVICGCSEGLAGWTASAIRALTQGDKQ
jgi:hypothetical protein